MNSITGLRPYININWKWETMAYDNGIRNEATGFGAIRNLSPRIYYAYKIY